MINNLMDAFSLLENERKVFLQVLECGGGPASVLARYCSIPRNTTRGILDKLVSLGLLTKSRQGVTQVYNLESQQNILQAIEQSERVSIESFKTKREALKNTAGLLWHQISKTRPKITIHEGYRGLERVYEDTLSANKEIRSWGSFDTNYETLPRYFKNYYRRRAQRKIKMRSIHPESKLASEHMRRNRSELRQGLLVPSAKFSWTPEIQIYDNKVSLVSWKEKIAVLIESQEISAALSNIFELSWLGVKYLKKNAH